MKFVLATLAALFATASAGGNNKGTNQMANCLQQQECIEFTIEPVVGNDCDVGAETTNCYFNICMVFVDTPTCVKDLDAGGTVSHTCMKDSTMCHDAIGFLHGTKVNSGEGGWDLGNNFIQCQKIKAGNAGKFHPKQQALVV